MHNGLSSLSNARILFLDMNSFFASVEQQYRPELRGKPLAVASHDAPNGTVLAASYDAKAFGIRTGTKLREARSACPSLTVVEPDQIRYRTVHNRFMDILRDIGGPDVVAHSIDEAALKLPPSWREDGKPQALALAIKERFRKELGPAIICSIGIAPNSFLAKVGSNIQKPNGLVEIRLETLEDTLSKLELTDLPGIGHRTVATLGLHGIMTVNQLYHTPAESLRPWWGISGQYWWWRLHGYEAESDRLKPRKSVSHEHVLKKWTYGKSAVEPIVLKMADRLIHRLRRNQYYCQNVWIYLRLAGAPGCGAERTFDGPTGSYRSLLHTIKELLHSLPETDLPIRKISLGFSSLTDAQNGEQMDLFQERPHDERLSRAIQLIRATHGEHSIRLGAVMRIPDKVAKEQLGFGRLKDRALSQRA